VALFFFSSRRRHTRLQGDWSSDVCSSDLEERIIGGTCVNRGCLPSKNLIEAAKIVHDAWHPRYPGLAPAKIDIDFRKLVGQKDDVIHGYRKKKYESLTGGKFAIKEGHVQFVD